MTLRDWEFEPCINPCSHGMCILVRGDPIVKTVPLNDEQSAMVAGYVRVRDWVNDSMRFDQHDERIAGWISEDA